MASEISVSLVALIVSLVALLLSIWQVLQSNFGTAEGRQRTNSTIMGNWADMTRWRWNFLEFRFLIKYVTPHIVLRSTDSLEESELYDQAHPSGGKRMSRDRWRLQKLHVLGRNTIPENIERRWDSPDGQLVGFSRRLRHLYRHVYAFLSHIDLEDFDSEIMVSWDRLLQIAFNYQQSVSGLHRNVWSSKYPCEILPEEGSEKQENTSPERVVSTVLCVKLKRRNWDYDTSRRMRWWDIRLPESYFRAEGNGYNITSTFNASFGLVVRMTVRTDHSETAKSGLGHRHPSLDLSNISADQMFIPSANADQMLCGIVPGDPSIVGPKRSFHTVGPMVKSRPEWLFNALQTHGDVQKFCNHGWRGRILVNDAVALLCPWMPLRGSPVVRIQFPVAYPAANPVSMMLYWEAREILRVRLKRRCEELTQKEKLEHPYFEIAHKHYETLAEGAAADDFYCRWTKSPIHSNGKAHGKSGTRYDQVMKERISMLEDVKEIFDSAQRFFEKRNRVDSEDDPPVPPIKYAELIRAYLSCLAIKVTRDDFKAHPTHNDEINKMMQDKKHSGPGLSRDMAETAHAVVDERFFVAEKLRFRDKERTTDLDVEEAWWMLMLRGICWRLSVYIEYPDFNALVPSSLYDDGSLVWMT